MGMDAGVPPEAPVEEEGSGDPVEILRDLLAGVMEYLEVEQDEEDKEKAAKALAIIQQLLSINQKQQDEMMGASNAAKGLRKQYGGQ